VETILKIYHQEELTTTMTFIEASWKVNESNRGHKQVLTDGTTLWQCESVMKEHNQQSECCSYNTWCPTVMAKPGNWRN
jgi:hypothetical protein